MFNVTPAQGQADCHLLKMPDGSNILVDAGDGGDAPGGVVEHLKKYGIQRLHLVVISHFHQDHYGALLDILKAGIAIDRIALNVPDKRITLPEMPWGCDWYHVQMVLAELKTRQVPYFTPQAGERIFETKTTDGLVASIDVLCAYDGVNTPFGQGSVNDTSIVLRVSHGATRILFTGDAGDALGSYLVESGADLRANLLKAPHHGTEGTVPNAFYAKVRPRAVLVPSPKALWESARSRRTRNYFIDRQIPVYVSGLHGDVTATLNERGYLIETEQ
jgi:competence protein ComEC